MTFHFRKAKRSLGALLLDSPKAAWPLLGPETLARTRWAHFHNRHERLISAPDGPGLACDWKWTSDLNLCRELPWTGRRLLRAALTRWPIQMEMPAVRGQSSEPRVSFIIGHRGLERLPHLRATLASLLAQEECRFEILVVEQAWKLELEGNLPDGVRWMSDRPETAQTPYSRSRAFNSGAREARGEILVFHDNDILAPARYGDELSKWFDRGYEAASLHRFVFYLERESSSRVASGSLRPSEGSPEAVTQNCQGGSIAVGRDAYFRIGGHDESFIGWGGEDNEFFDRVGALRGYLFGYLPFVHLHHPVSRGREWKNVGSALLEERMRTPRALRIERLQAQFAPEAAPEMKR